jgi:hypothetical protein
MRIEKRVNTLTDLPSTSSPVPVHVQAMTSFTYSADSALDGVFHGSPGGSLQHLRDPAVDPIAHRPPGRLAHRLNMPGLDRDSFEGTSSQIFRFGAVSTPRSPPSAISPAIYDSQPHSPVHPHLPTRYGHLFSHPAVTPSSPAPETSLFHNPSDGGPGYADDYNGGWHSGVPPHVSDPRKRNPCLPIVITMFTFSSSRRPACPR